MSGVETGIGATLREARTRRKIDLAEVEAATKIRVRYLQAIENEEWDALPGGAYTRGFIRTYANELGLDGERLAEDYRRRTSPAGAERVPRRVEPVPSGSRGERRGPSSRAVALGVGAVLVVVLILVGLLGGGSDDPAAPEPQRSGSPAAGGGGGGQKKSAAAPQRVEVALTATAEVWVCLVRADGKAMVDGEILPEGSSVGPFKARGFELALGNGSAEIDVDGEPAEVPESSSPIGFAIGIGGAVEPLEEGERPDCE